jgi:bifunctional ADP-heptose synthase (sugar kinase/adenylyltransferase)
VNASPLDEETENAMLESLARFYAHFDVVLVVDQHEAPLAGVITPRVRNMLADLGASHPERVQWVDSRGQIENFRHAVLKPNQQEAEAACTRLGCSGRWDGLRAHTDAPLLVVTQAEAGITLLGPNGRVPVQTFRAPRVVDVTGAGDSFSAGAASALTLTRNAPLAMRFGSLVSAVTLGKPGTGVATPEELLAMEAELSA